ncbi:hypothetical protein CRENBAI_023484 [Crenichthys baileyi]|uniref:Uncharacterized protein n=1 Tax=Crenichthys baileyi TaxID=28760 RepID=A0AAV9SGQ5_9TELE
MGSELSAACDDLTWKADDPVWAKLQLLDDMDWTMLWYTEEFTAPSNDLTMLPAPANQHRVCISSSANHHPRLRFKDHSWTSSLFKLSCDPPPPHLHHLAS